MCEWKVGWTDGLMSKWGLEASQHSLYWLLIHMGPAGEKTSTWSYALYAVMGFLSMHITLLEERYRFDNGRSKINLSHPQLHKWHQEMSEDE